MRRRSAPFAVGGEESEPDQLILSVREYQLAEVPLSLSLGAVNGHIARIGGSSERGIFPGPIPIRISPRFQTSHPDYLWLNRLHCLGVEAAFPERAEVAYDVHAVR